MFPIYWNSSLLPGHFGLLMPENQKSKKEVTLIGEMIRIRVTVLFWETRLLLHSGVRKIIFGM